MPDPRPPDKKGSRYNHWFREIEKAWYRDIEDGSTQNN